MNRNYDVPAKVIGAVVRTLLEQGAIKVTAYLSPILTVKASRVMYGNKIDGRDSRADVRVTLGKPNYAERKFIKAALAANEPFPIKKYQIRQL